MLPADPLGIAGAPALPPLTEVRDGPLPRRPARGGAFSFGVAERAGPVPITRQKATIPIVTRRSARMDPPEERTVNPPLRAFRGERPAVSPHPPNPKTIAFQRIPVVDAPVDVRLSFSF